MPIFRTSIPRQRCFFVPVEWCGTSIVAVNFELQLLNVSRQFPEYNVLLLFSIRLVAVQRVVESVPMLYWVKSFSKYAMVSLHCSSVLSNRTLIEYRVSHACSHNQIWRAIAHKSLQALISSGWDYIGIRVDSSAHLLFRF